MGIAGGVALLAIGCIPLSIWYYLWLGRRLAPRLVPLPLAVGITVFGLAVALPWVVGAALVWLVAR